MRKEIFTLATTLASITGSLSATNLEQVSKLSSEGTKISALVNPDYRMVDLTKLPTQLPVAVRQMLGTVVSTEVSPTGTGGILPNGIPEKLSAPGVVLGSGVRIRLDTYLSAGHLVMRDNNTYSKSAELCSDDMVMGPSLKPTERINYNGRDLALYGTDLGVEKLVATFVEGDTSKIPDVALLYASDKNHTLPTEQSASIATKMPRLGEEIFFVNFQPTPQGLFRNASQYGETALNYYIGNFDNPSLTMPAIIGGIAIGQDANGDLEVADGLRSYDPLGDNALIPGASGGAAFNSLGQLIGISVEATAINKPLTVAQLASKYAIHLVGLAQDNPIFDTTIQAITTDEIKELDKSISHSSNCGN